MSTCYFDTTEHVKTAQFSTVMVACLSYSLTTERRVSNGCEGRTMLRNRMISRLDSTSSRTDESESGELGIYLYIRAWETMN